ncbi:unnamed protein product [Vicia faba]|uniref:Uncharacterized protein n=1 Tax=Vicia faba TaxID=3906 RepID=A0AAV0Z455_VICFA|nr:unnamed protein product [Vicia faba]
MSVFAPLAIYKVAKDAAGIAGNIFAFGLFVSPIPTFRRIIRNGSTEMFSGLPYIYSLMNCLICLCPLHDECWERKEGENACVVDGCSWCICNHIDWKFAN